MVNIQLVVKWYRYVSSLVEAVEDGTWRENKETKKMTIGDVEEARKAKRELEDMGVHLMARRRAD